MAPCVQYYIKLLLLFLHLILVNGEISDLRLCANPSCDEPVSHAKTLLKYIGNDKYSLTFLPNTEVIIYSKSAGNVPHLWGGTIKGKRGYFPRKFVREYKVLTSNLPFTVPTEEGLITEKQLELNDSTKELLMGTSTSLSNSDIRKETLNAKGDNSGGDEHVTKFELPNNGNVSDNEITQELGSNPGPEFADLDYVPKKSIPDQKSPIDLKPTKSVSEADIPYSKVISGKEQAIESSPDIIQISPSKSDYLNLPPSAFSTSPSLTNIVAHTKEISISDNDGLANSAVWFPERKEPSLSFFGHGVSADSSVDEKAGSTNENLSPDLESWAGVTASAGNEKYVMVEGTQIPIHEDEEPDATAVPALSATTFSVPVVGSAVSTPKPRLPEVSNGNFATANAEAIIDNVQLDGPAPSMVTATPVESTLAAEASLSQSNYLPSDQHQTLETSTRVQQTNVEGSSDLAEAEGVNSVEGKSDPRVTERGGGGEAPAMSENQKESESDSDAKAPSTSQEGKSDRDKDNEIPDAAESQTTVEQQDFNGKESGGWYDSMRNFVTLDVLSINDSLKASEADMTTQSTKHQETPADVQNNDEKQGITKEIAALNGLEDDDEVEDEDDHDNDPFDDPEGDDVEDSAEEDEEDQDHAAVVSGQYQDSSDAGLEEKSYHDRIVEKDGNPDSPDDQSVKKTDIYAPGDSNENAKSLEAQVGMDQSTDNRQGEVFDSENVKTLGREHKGSAVNGDDGSIITENTPKDNNIANDGTSVAGGPTEDEKREALEGKRATLAENDKSAAEAAESTGKDVSETGDNESVVGKDDSLTKQHELVTENSETVVEKGESVTEKVESLAQKDKVVTRLDKFITNKYANRGEKVESPQTYSDASISSENHGDAVESVPSQALEGENLSTNATEKASAVDINVNDERPRKTLGESLEFQGNTGDLPGDETASVSTEPTFGIDESLNTPLPEDIVTTEATDLHLGESAFFKDSTKNANVKDDLGTCQGPGIDGTCGSLDEIFVENSESSEQQSFWESTASHVLLIRSYMQAIIDLLPDSIKMVLYDLEKSAVSPRVVIFVLIVGSFLFLLEIAFIAIKTRCKESSLLGKISCLDQQLFTITKERDILKTNVESYADQNLEGEYRKAQATIQALQAKLKMSQNECGKLQGTVSSLEEQLETATEAGLELNQLLSEFLTSQNDSGKLQNAVLQFQEQLNDQQKRFGEMQLDSEATQHEKDKLDEELQNVRSNYDLIVQKYDKINQDLDDVNSVKEGLQQLVSSKDEEVNQLQESNTQLLKEAEVWDESVKQLQIKINEDQEIIQDLEDATTFKNNEIEALKDCLLKLKIAQGKADGDIVDDSEESSPTSKTDNILERLMDVSSIKAELKSVVDERDSILAKLEIQHNARLIAEDQVKKYLLEAEQAQAEYEKANLEREAAQTKLNVLSNYFKEKELQLQRELGIQEAQRQQSQESVISVTQRIAMYEQETSLYKSQITGLKVEIESQERSYKTQLTAHEKKAHENWLAARAAERKLEESKQEAATLRNRLTLLEQEKANQALNQTDAGKTSLQSYQDNNGEVPSPPRLVPGDRSDSMDLPTSSRSSIFSREPLDILHGLPFLPPDRPLPPPFMRGMPPGGLLPPPPLLPPMDDRLPLPPFDPRRGMFPLPPGPLVGGLPLEHWMGPRRRGSPPFDHPSQRDRPSPPLLSQRSPPPFDRRPPSSRNAVSPLEPDSRDMGAPYERDYRERTPPARFFDPPIRPGFGGHPPPAMRGPPNSRPPMRRDVYPPGRADGSIDPRTSSPMTPKQDGNGTAA